MHGDTRPRHSPSIRAMRSRSKSPRSCADHPAVDCAEDADFDLDRERHVVEATNGGRAAPQPVATRRRRAAAFSIYCPAGGVPMRSRIKLLLPLVATVLLPPALMARQGGVDKSLF